MAKRKNPCIFRYAKFGRVSQRRAYRVMRCRSRSTGRIRVIVSQLKDPYGDWHIIVPADSPDEEQLAAFLNFQKSNSVLDTESQQFYWHKTAVSRFFR